MVATAATSSSPTIQDAVCWRATRTASKTVIAAVLAYSWGR